MWSGASRSTPISDRTDRVGVTGKRGGASTPSRSRNPRTSLARLVDRTATVATCRRRRQRATASRRRAGPTPVRTLANSRRDTSSCTSDGSSISCRDRAPVAVKTAREPTATSSQPKGSAPTPLDGPGRDRRRPSSARGTSSCRWDGLSTSSLQPSLDRGRRGKARSRSLSGTAFVHQRPSSPYSASCRLNLTTPV